jgi:hypothetical protein
MNKETGVSTEVEKKKRCGRGGGALLGAYKTRTGGKLSKFLVIDQLLGACESRVFKNLVTGSHRILFAT